MEIIDSTQGDDKVGYAQVLYAIYYCNASSTEDILEAIKNYTLEDELNVLGIAQRLAELEEDESTH